MIYLGFPYGSNFGWGVLGKEIAFALAELVDLKVLSPPNSDQRLDDEFDRFRMRPLLANSVGDANETGETWRIDGPVIQTAVGPGLDPFVPQVQPPSHVAYAVFEENLLPKSAISRAQAMYRHVAAGSSYCANVLREHGLTDVSTLPHGVDSDLFSPRIEPRSIFKDRFIVFSGGKFELRKGHDIVIRAYKVLQDRHRDVMLVNSWFNGWVKSRDTMAASPLIRYIPLQGNDHIGWINFLLSANGIDLDRVITTAPRDHRLLPTLYHTSDLGIFPNRVEGGNNMVLMEYLACGKPALVSYNSGHTDIVNRHNSVLIETHRKMERRNGNELMAVWNDPSVDETIDKLEWCYQNRDKLHPLAAKAAEEMRTFSWKRLAEGLLERVYRIETGKATN